LPLGSPQFVSSEVNQIVTDAVNRYGNAIGIICDLAIENPFHAGLLARIDFMIASRLSKSFVIADGGRKASESRCVKNWTTTLAILPLLSVSLVLAEDFTTINGKTYKNATISRVEADEIVLKTKMEFPRSISLNSRKIFRNGFVNAAATPIAAHREREPIKVATKQDNSHRSDSGGWVGALGSFSEVANIGSSCHHRRTPGYHS
jgi:hypothetical protein